MDECLSLNEVIEQLLRLKQLLESAGRDCNAVGVYYERVPIKTLEPRDDGSGCDNLDVILHG